MNIYDPDEVNANEALTLSEAEYIDEINRQAWNNVDWDAILADEKALFKCPNYTAEELSALNLEDIRNGVWDD